MTVSHKQLDPNFNHPLRFSIMALLARTERMSFRGAKEILDTSDSQLSKHAGHLAEQGYLKVCKSHRGKTPSTSYEATEKGREAWREHVAHLRAIVEG